MNISGQVLTQIDLHQNLKYKNGLNVLESAYMVAIGPTSAMAASRMIEADLPCAREISRPMWILAGRHTTSRPTNNQNSLWSVMISLKVLGQPKPEGHSIDLINAKP